MSQAKFTASERADKRVTSDELKKKKKDGLALIGQVQKTIATAEAMKDGEYE